MSWNFQSLPKFLGICIVTYGSLLILYEYTIRHTPIGTLLNGRKVRTPKLPRQS